MYWIDRRFTPLKEGKYKCLIDIDGLGNLREYGNQYFDGKDWCHFESQRQFIQYWEASEEDYRVISGWQEDEYEKYMNELEEHSRNFGGL